MKVWTIIGASRGIGHEFVKQILTDGDRVLATVRSPTTVDSLWPGAAQRCQLYTCDMLAPASIENLASEISTSGVQRLDYLIINAGVLQYPNRATEMSYDNFMLHLQTNTIGPIITAQKLLATGIEIGLIVFISSDSGSVTNFNEYEDGFAAYAASKAALNQSLRHMAAELKRNGSSTTVIALHPGEVKTDMAEIEVAWEVHGQMTASDSVSQCLQTIKSKTSKDHGTFWTWQNEPYPCCPHGQGAQPTVHAMTRNLLNESLRETWHSTEKLQNKVEQLE